MYGLAVVVVIFLVVGEDHQLCDVEESSETTLAHPFVDAFSLCQNAVMVIWLFHFDKYQRESIDKAGDVRTEIVIGVLVFAWQFGGDVPVIVLWMVEVDELNAMIG